MKTIYIIFFLSLSLCTESMAQIAPKIIYYDNANKVCSKDSANHYRTVEKADTLFLITEYFVKGSIVTKGLSTTDGETLYKIGEYTTVFKNQNLTLKENYVNNMREGASTIYFQDGSVYATQNYEQDNLNGTSYYYFPNHKIRRYEKYVHGKLLEKKCYSRKGKDTTYYAATRYPVFDKGKQTMNEYLAEHIKYPREIEKKGIEGSTNVRFLIDKDGTVSDVYAVDEIDETLKQEAIRVVSEMPKWEPAANFDIPVRVKYNVKITFKLKP